MLGLTALALAAGAAASPFDKNKWHFDKKPHGWYVENVPKSASLEELERKDFSPLVRPAIHRQPTVAWKRSSVHSLRSPGCARNRPRKFSEVVNTEQSLKPDISVVASPIKQSSVTYSSFTLSQVERDVEVAVIRQITLRAGLAVAPLLFTIFESNCASTAVQ